MIRSPGIAASIAPWIVLEALTWVGAFPPMVTFTASTDCLPLPAVITSCPHSAAEPPNCACCCIGHAGTPDGTVTVIDRSVQPVIAAGIPPMVTEDNVLQVVLPE